MSRPAIDTIGLTELSGYSERHCRRIGGECEHFFVDGIGGASGKNMMVYVDSLPDWMQLRWHQRNFSTEDPLATCDEEMRYRLQALEEGIKAESKRFAKQVQAGLKGVCRDFGISIKTYRRWQRAYEKDGLEGLRISRGAQLKPITDEVKRFIEDCYYQQACFTVAKALRKTNRFCHERGIEGVTRYQVQRIIDLIPEAKKMVTRQGKRIHYEKNGFFQVRDLNELRVNQVWCGDHRQFDVFVFETPRSEKPIRPWLTAWEDLRTRKICGWAVCKKPNSRSIAVALQKGISKAGLPEMVYVDNGKDYKSYYFSGHQSARFRVGFDHRLENSLTERLNVRVSHALPYSPQSKPIESLFRLVSVDFDVEMPGYCGRDNKRRPVGLGDDIKARRLMTLDDLKEEISVWVECYNGERVHSAIGCTPNSLYEGFQHQRIPEFELETLLWPREQKKIGRRGFKLFGNWYWDHEDMCAELKFRKTHYTVVYNPDDVSHIYVFDGEELMCTCYPLQAVLPVGTSQEDMARLKRIKAKENELRNQYLQRVYPTAQEEVFERIAARKNKPVEAPAPMPGNVYVMTEQTRIAKQIMDAEKEVRVPVRKTGTDPLPLLNVGPPVEEKDDLPLLNIKPLETEKEELPIIIFKKE